MKKISLTILFTLFSIYLFSQDNLKIINAYYDAIKLKEFTDEKGLFLYKDENGAIDKPKIRTYLSLLQAYFPDLHSKDLETFVAEVQNKTGNNYNPFFDELFKNINTNDGTSNSIDPSQKVNKSIINSVGSLNITNFADGLAKFLVERAKQELSVAFFDRLKEVFKNYPEFEVLFPNTHENLLIIESYNFSSYLNTLRTGFTKDVDNLTVNLAKIEKLKVADCNGVTDIKCKKRIYNYQAFFNKDGGRLFSTSLVFIEELKNGTNPAALISNLANNSDFENLEGEAYSNIKSIVKLSDLISQSFLSTKENQTWVSYQEIKDLIKNEKAFKIYLGLLYQQEATANIKFKIKDGISEKETTFREILKITKDNTNKIKNYIENLAIDLNQINVAIHRFKEFKKAGDQPESKDYFQFYNGIISFISDTSNFNTLSLQFNDEQEKVIKQYIDLANAAGNIYEDLTLNNYSSAIMNIRVFLQKTELEEYEFYQQFLKYGTFMASVAEAENSDQVQQIIESVALPAGSATIKKRTERNISLNAYVGLSGGTEFNGDLGEFKPSFGLNAPVGIAFNKGLFNKNGNSFGSCTWFLSLIDVGAVTTFRFGDSETEELPEIKLQNIFAPGLYYVHGFNKWPLSIGLGGQLGPQLRTVTAEDVNLNSDPSFSFKVFLAIDIPILNFYTKSK